jgi:hypothetical protein
MRSGCIRGEAVPDPGSEASSSQLEAPSVDAIR